MREDKTIYALGFFDGVHLGHQALLAACKDLAAETGAKTGVVTFSAHPDTLVLGKTPPFINSPQDRKLLLQQLGGVEQVVTLPFDREMMNMPWQDFFQMLLADYGAAGLVCGEDFTFGRRGEGNAALLREAAAKARIPCRVVRQRTYAGVVISSTHIRSLLVAGEMEKAVEFLGHPHVLTGQVISGQQLGRTLGIPTANLALPQGVICPRFGVYACKAKVQGQWYPAVTNVGCRPTVGGKTVTVEPWLLGFAGDIYGETLCLEFYKFLRPEKKFPSLEAMQEEILKNARQTQEFFGKK
ncbi:MAG TPA: bifunctional riboflavin kinase/FAD synthetase [Candidatus Faecousia excrementipullorum]|nr:bifunctional riboflavin kinase/FAD synthetase [Candidatus Faecousia excrementipullorum]